MATGEVSVRELRQNLSVHLRRVQAGETLAVLNRGERVAILTPVAGAARIDRLIAEGKATPARSSGGLPAPVKLADASPTPLSDALRAMRDEDAR